MATHVMPIRGERGAPTFDQKQPNDLGRYFEQLETLFARCQVQDDADRKKFAMHITNLKKILNMVLDIFQCLVY